MLSWRIYQATLKYPTSCNAYVRRSIRWLLPTRLLPIRKHWQESVKLPTFRLRVGAKSNWEHNGAINYRAISTKEQQLLIDAPLHRLCRFSVPLLPIPLIEEWKSARTLRPWHRAQMGCYFLLVEEELRIRPSHGFIVLGDDTRHRIDNTEELRAWVLGLAGQIRAARAAVGVPIPVEPKPGQCRPCGMRGHCRQAMA